MKKIILSAFFIWLAWGIQAQDYNAFFVHRPHISPDDAGKLYFSFENTNFIKNDEYFGKLLSGYTYIGFFARPQIVYYPHKNIKISGGVHLLKYSGLNSFTTALPVFTVQYTPVSGLDVLLGTIDGNLNHQLIEPLYDFERYFTHNVENGAQILLDKKRVKMDVWIEWEHFIFRTGNDQEHIVGGTTADLLLTKKESASRISIPLQAIVAHKGGQYHQPNQILQTLINSAVGIKYAFQIKNRWIHSFGTEDYFLGYKDVSPQPQLPYQKGSALNFNVFIKYPFVQLWVGYWKGHHFISSRGNPLFMSVSQENPTFLEPESELVTAKISFRKKIYRDIAIEARFESYYDLPQKQFQYAYSFYLTFNSDFFLGKVK